MPGVVETKRLQSFQLPFWEGNLASGGAFCHFYVFFSFAASESCQKDIFFL
jgi:hypothetical protein